MQADAFLLMYLRQSFKSTLNFICKYMDFHRMSQILKHKNVYFQGYPDTEIKLGGNIFTVEKELVLRLKHVNSQLATVVMYIYWLRIILLLISDTNISINSLKGTFFIIIF